MLRGTEVAVKKIVASDASQEVIADFELECAIMAYVLLLIFSFLIAD